MMTKYEMIEQIRQHNRSARQDFLVHFDEQALSTYLNRLTRISGKRGRDTVWVRESCDPAITARTAAA